MSEWLAVDFGTSNSAAAYIKSGEIRRVNLEDSADTIPTAVFFRLDRRDMDVGTVATAAMIDGVEGRYMRSLKSVLGTALMAEKRTIVGRRVDFYDIISQFLSCVKARSEVQAGCTFDKVVAGRPVFFDSRSPDNDARAKSDLERCYKMAGFSEIVFMPEPEAAALSIDQTIGSTGTGIVVDIGGGTSDFSVFRKVGAETQVLASNGIRLGGTDFDRAINLEFIMPCLGYGRPIRLKMSGEILSAPNAIFVDLATWQKIPFLYDHATQTLVKGLIRDAVEPVYFERLRRVIDMQLGHDIALLSEKTKIASNEVKAFATIDLGLLEAGLTVEARAERLDLLYEPFTNTISNALKETLVRADISGADISHVIPVGGSSLMRLVQAAIFRVVPNAIVVEASIFTAIVDGLASHIKALSP